MKATTLKNVFFRVYELSRFSHKDQDSKFVNHGLREKLKNSIDTLTDKSVEKIREKFYFSDDSISIVLRNNHSLESGIETDNFQNQFTCRNVQLLKKQLIEVSRQKSLRIVSLIMEVIRM